MARTIVGIVTSNKTDKTIVITVQERKTHPLYRKQYTVTKKFMAHDEQNEAQPGDKVSIVETKPISKRKRFTLGEIIEKPALREESLSVAKSEDTGKKPAKVKAEEAEAAPVAAKAPAKVQSEESAKSAASPKEKVVAKPRKSDNKVSSATPKEGTN